MHSFYRLTDEEIAAWLRRHQQPAYRAKQLCAGVYRRGVASFGEMTDLPRALRQQLAAELDLRPTTPLAVAESDNGTRELLEQLLVGEETHADWLQTQLELIERIGVQNYLASQLGGG